MTDNIPQEDHQYYCKELANALRYYVVASETVPAQHAAEAIDLLADYTEFEAAGRRIPLKNEIRDAILSCSIDGYDPLKAILVAIANRAKDAVEHFQDDTEIVDDIRSWLLYEADQPEIGA